MSAELESMFYIGEVPWHGLGTYIGDKPVTSDEAIVAAGLDWEAKLRPLVASSVDGYPIDVTTHNAVVRVSDDQILGIVGNRYECVQNKDAFKFMDSLVREGLMRYHTAGSLRGGQVVWLLGKVGSFEVLNGDQVDEYIFLYNSHDGSSALRCLPTTIRVVCMNTANAALEGGKHQGISVRHTANIMDRLEDAKEILVKSSKSLTQFKEFAQYASKIQVNVEKTNEFLLKMFPNPPKNIKSLLAEKTRNQVLELIEDGRGTDIPGVRGTGWGLFNAVTEYANYYKRSIGKNQQERRFESVLFGGSVNIITRAAQEVLALAA